MTIIGIDPGIMGGIAAISGKKIVELQKIPKGHDPERINAIFRNIKAVSKTDAVIAVVEKPIIKPHFIVRKCPHCRRLIRVGVPQQGILTSISNYGMLLGLLASNGIKYVEVPSSTWKKQLSLSSDKQKSLDLAKKLYPKCADIIKYKNQEGMAEALLIAHYFLTKEEK